MNMEDDVDFRVGFVTAVVSKARTLINDIFRESITAQWKVDSSAPYSVDLADSIWVTVEADIPQTREIVSEYIALWSPVTISLMLDIIDSHVNGISQLLLENPELRGRINVSEEVFDLAKKLNTQVLRDEVIDPETGEWEHPRYYLGRQVWKDDE